jgi:hypothetical protein
MARDTDGYLRKLRKRGYRVPDRRDGQGHIEVWYGGELVTSASGSRPGGRGFLNFKSQIRRFEEDKATRKTRKRSRS